MQTHKVSLLVQLTVTAELQQGQRRFWKLGQNWSVISHQIQPRIYSLSIRQLLIKVITCIDQSSSLLSDLHVATKRIWLHNHVM